MGRYRRWTHTRHFARLAPRVLYGTPRTRTRPPAMAACANWRRSKQRSRSESVARCSGAVPDRNRSATAKLDVKNRQGAFAVIGVANNSADAPDCLLVCGSLLCCLHCRVVVAHRGYNLGPMISRVCKLYNLHGSSPRRCRLAQTRERDGSRVCRDELEGGNAADHSGVMVSS